MAHVTNTCTLQLHKETSASHIPACKTIYLPQNILVPDVTLAPPHTAAQYQAVPKKITTLIQKSPTHFRSILRHYQPGQNTYY
eukprot:14865620-Ditylum_brightwellii.AAC.1